MSAMKHSETDSAIRRNLASDRNSGSFLVRVWYEAREASGEEPSFRGYIRNLQTGEERFVRDPKTVSEQIVRQVEGAAPARRTERAHERRATR